MISYTIEPCLCRPSDARKEQWKDLTVMEAIKFLEEGVLPEGEKRTHKLALQAHIFVILDQIHCHLNSKQHHCRDEKTQVHYPITE